MDGVKQRQRALSATVCCPFLSDFVTTIVEVFSLSELLAVPSRAMEANL